MLAILKKQLFVSFIHYIMVALSEIKKITIVLSRQYCVIVEAAKTRFLLQLQKGKIEIYIWNELHSIVAVKYNYSSILGRLPTRG